MNLNMGSQCFRNVDIPLLWGSRAVIADESNKISIISISKEKVQLEVLFDEPAPGINYEIIADGFKIIQDDEELYSFNPSNHLLTGLSLKLPECQITASNIRVGNSTFQGNIVMGSAVGISVTENGIGMGASLPPEIARLIQ